MDFRFFSLLSSVSGIMSQCLKDNGYVKMMTFELSLRDYPYTQWEDEKWAIIDKDGRVYLRNFGTGFYSKILVIYEEEVYNCSISYKAIAAGEL